VRDSPGRGREEDFISNLNQSWAQILHVMLSKDKREKALQAIKHID
jgi:hypothetical protein